MPWLLALLGLFAVTHAAFYHSFYGRQISEATYRQYEALNLVPYCAIEVRECDEHERRRMDWTCNNLHSPQRGATLTPYRRMLPPMFDPSFYHRPSSSGAPLPWARKLRTSIMSDGQVASKQYTHLVPNLMVYIIGDVTSVHDTSNYVVLTTNCCQPGGQADPRCQPIYVPEDDMHLRRSDIRCLNLTRAITYQDLGCVPRTVPPERVNTASPLLDMSIIYGNDALRARRSRAGRGGRLKSEMLNGREWPPGNGTGCFQNQVARGETRCHDTAVKVTNVLIGGIVLTVWTYRVHNSVARELERMNPCWDDDTLYYTARDITTAYFNNIIYYELMVTALGYEYLLKNRVIYDTWGHVNDYDPKLEPRVSIEYVVAARWFHSMQEGRIWTYDNNGKLLQELRAVELTLRTGILPVNRTMEGITQSFFRQPAAEADYLIDPDMGERVLGGLQRASDVMSSDITKGRDVGLPPYNHYRKICNLPVAEEWEDLEKWMPKEKVEAMKLNYETVEDVDLMAGILSERRMPGAAVGPTLACIMADQLLYWRRADRFWYENDQHPYAFTPEQLKEIRKVSMAHILCEYGDEVDSVQPWPLLVPGDGNEIDSCKKIYKPSLAPWRDDSCRSHVTPHTATQDEPRENKNSDYRSPILPLL